MEPVDLWQRYIDPEFRARAPRRLDERRWDIRTLVEGEVMAQIPGGDWPALTDAEETALAARYPKKSRGTLIPKPSPGNGQGGLDLAILFPTSAMYVTAFTRMDRASRRRRAAPTTTGSTTTSGLPTQNACSALPLSRRTRSKAQSPKPAVP